MAGSNAPHHPHDSRTQAQYGDSMSEKPFHPKIERWLNENPMPRAEADALLSAPDHACACLGIIDPTVPRVAHDARYTHACECTLRYERARRAATPTEEP